MDRRGFLTGLGTLGAAAAGGWGVMEAGARGTRADGLAKAAGASGKASSARGGAPTVQALTVGYLPGSAGLLDYAARGQQWPQLATQMRWATWEPSFALPIFER